jgi:hypothetical protein
MPTNWFKFLVILASFSLIINLIFAGICFKSAADIQEINSTIQKMSAE